MRVQFMKHSQNGVDSNDFRENKLFKYILMAIIH